MRPNNGVSALRFGSTAPICMCPCVIHRVFRAGVKGDRVCAQVMTRSYVWLYYVLAPIKPKSKKKKMKKQKRRKKQRRRRKKRIDKANDDDIKTEITYLQLDLGCWQFFFLSVVFIIFVYHFALRVILLLLLLSSYNTHTRIRIPLLRRFLFWLSLWLCSSDRNLLFLLFFSSSTFWLWFLVRKPREYVVYLIGGSNQLNKYKTSNQEGKDEEKNEAKYCALSNHRHNSLLGSGNSESTLCCVWSRELWWLDGCIVILWIY